MDNGSIKDNIIRQRNKQKISQEEMARRIGLVRNSYRNIECGDTKIINEHIYDIAAVLDTTPEELVLGYKPTDASVTLEDLKMKYESKQNELISKHEHEKAEYLSKIATLETIISDLRETIASKNEIISLLKRTVSNNSGQNG